MVGIRDVARRANVSPGTVSRLLNNDKTLSVSAATRERIYQAVEALDYDVNKRKYQKKKLPSIGVIATISRQSELDDPYFNQLRTGIEEEARKLHLGLNRVYNLSENPREWKDFDHLGAVIVVGTVTEPSLQELMKQNKNIVVVDNPDITQEVDLVYADFERMTQRILSLFLAAGHRRIAYIGGYNIDVDQAGHKEFNENEKRLRTYKQFMQEQGLAEAICYKIGQWEPLEGKRMAEELLAENNPFPTAILVGSDPLSVGVYRALQSAGKKIGKDVVIASFDDIEISEFLTPNLTTVRINGRAIGRAAVRLANERIEGIRQEPVVMTFPSKLVIRESFVPEQL